jgi:hypothetical protein
MRYRHLFLTKFFNQLFLNLLNFKLIESGCYDALNKYELEDSLLLQTIEDKILDGDLSVENRLNKNKSECFIDEKRIKKESSHSKKCIRFPSCFSN